jgi:hypothetical protein
MTLEISLRSTLLSLLLSACLVGYLVGAHSAERMAMCGGEEPITAASNLGLTPLL